MTNLKPMMTKVIVPTIAVSLVSVGLRFFFDEYNVFNHVVTTCVAFGFFFWLNAKDSSKSDNAN